MSVHVCCVTSAGGLPIFSRKKGNAESLPFSTIGSLNGVHMFGKSQKIELLNTLTDDYTVTWKEFYDSLVLIGISTGCTVEVLNRTLELIFDAIVLIVGIDEVKAQKNIERLKRELRVCYPLIDRLLDSLDCGDSANKHPTDLIGMAETILCPENHLIQIVLDSYTEHVDSLFSCILIQGKLAAATESWWSLKPEEIELLALLATAENTTSSKDVPVFLPYKSPTVAFRFVCCTLIADVQLCCLCGSSPTLQEIELSATQCFRNSSDTLNAAAQCHPRNFPAYIQIDSGVLGLLLANPSNGKYMISKNPHQNVGKKIASSSHRSDILRTFYYRAVLMQLVPHTDEKKNDKKNKQKSKSYGNETYGIETYWCSEYHKCHALRIDDNILCVLYNSSVPNYAMHTITEKILKQFINDKQIGW